MNEARTPASYRGSCLCGAIRFRIHAELAPIQVCHCAQCRKAQGGPFATNIPIARAAFELVAGGQLLRGFESSPGKTRHFCAACGSPVYSSRAARPETMRIRAGLIDEPLAVRPAPARSLIDCPLSRLREGQGEGASKGKVEPFSTGALEPLSLPGGARSTP